MRSTYTMKFVSTSLRCLICCTAISLSVIACAAGNVAVDNEARGISQGDRELAQKQDTGLNHAGAAEEYRKLAAKTTGDIRNEYLLKEAAALIQSSKLEEAGAVLLSLNQSKPTPAHSQHGKILGARIALQQRKPELALEILKDLVGNDIPATIAADAHALRSDAYFARGQLLEAVHELIARNTLLNDRNLKEDNQQKIWQLLMDIPEAALAQSAATPPDVFSGWLELARYARNLPPEPDMLSWHDRYPEHPAADFYSDLLTQILAHSTPLPQNIALLLPHSGPYAKAATAVRDGFIAAYLHRERQDYTPKITVYDTGKQGASLPEIYAKAVNEGADFVVGPLDRDSVNTLIRSNINLLPTLALNYADPGLESPALLHQFGLSPEDEVRQAAERAWLDGRSYALALYPEGDWGSRVFAEFSSRWQQLGGTILEAKSYAPDQKDYSETLRGLLNIDESEARFRALRAALNSDIKFEPRRRQDSDFIMMLAFTAQARAIRPQLKFFYAADLAVYATSHVFSGKLDPGKDRDMDGIIFADIPWILNTEPDPLRTYVMQAWPEPGDGSTRLFALGVDAFNLVTKIDRLRAGKPRQVAGATGILTMDSDRRIHRGLLWARMIDGKPKLLQTQESEIP